MRKSKSYLKCKVNASVTAVISRFYLTISLQQQSPVSIIPIRFTAPAKLFLGCKIVSLQRNCVLRKFNLLHLQQPDKLFRRFYILLHFYFCFTILIVWCIRKLYTNHSSTFLIRFISISLENSGKKILHKNSKVPRAVAFLVRQKE